MRFACPFSFVLVLPLVIMGLAFWSPGGEADEPDLTILYTADVHGHVLSSEQCIGIDRIAAIKKSLPNSLLVDSGDFLSGMPLAGLSRGRDIVVLMKAAGYAAAAVGNHEFDYSLNELLARAADAAAPPHSMAFLSANVLTRDNTPLLARETELTVNGIKVCMFGLTSEAAKARSRPSTVDELLFADALSTARDMARSQRARGCEVVLALSHIGSYGYLPVKSRDIAAQIPEIDVVIDGNSHIELESRRPGAALLVSPGMHAERLGRLDIYFDKNSRAVTRIDNVLLTPEDSLAYEPEPLVAQKLTRMQNEQEKLLANVVGNLQADLIGAKPFVRLRETSLGKACAEALRLACRTDFAILNGGSFGTDLRKGPVTSLQLMAALPFHEPAVVVHVSGKELHDIMEHSLLGLPEANSAFPQISGFSVLVDPERPPRSRVMALLLPDGRPVEADKHYALSVSSFLAGGGDGYPHLAGKEQRGAYESVGKLFIEHLNTRIAAGHEATGQGGIVFVSNTP